MIRKLDEEGYIAKKALECGIPERMIGGLAFYILYRIQPGSFLEAVLENDLMEALGRADFENAGLLNAYARFIYNYAPQACHGSKAKVKAWLEAFVEVGHE